LTLFYLLFILIFWGSHCENKLLIINIHKDLKFSVKIVYPWLLVICKPHLHLLLGWYIYHSSLRLLVQINGLNTNKNSNINCYAVHLSYSQQSTGGPKMSYKCTKFTVTFYFIRYCAKFYNTFVFWWRCTQNPYISLEIQPYTHSSMIARPQIRRHLIICAWLN
jgi:hypothetical protein